MNNKELSKHLYGLILHALLVTAFGFILMSIATLADFAAGWLRCPGATVIKVLQVALEVPFFLTVISLVVTGSRAPLSDLSSVASPAIARLRRRAVKRPSRAGRAHREDCPRGRAKA